MVYYCIRQTRVRQCTDPRDRVYSVLGIVSTISHSKSDAQALDIVPDYGKSVVAVYTEAMTSIIQGIGLLTPLMEIKYPSKLSADGLPSWVADLTDPKYPTILDTTANFSHPGYKEYDASRKLVDFTFVGRPAGNTNAGSVGGWGFSDRLNE